MEHARALVPLERIDWLLILIYFTSVPFYDHVHLLFYYY